LHRWISVWLQTTPIPLRSRTLAAAQDGKAYASEFNASPDSVGGAGASSGGHTSMPAAMRPDDPRHTTLSSPDVDDHDGKVAYTIAGSPPLDSYARYQNA